MTGNEFGKQADKFVYELEHVLKNMPETWPEDKKRAIYEEYMEKYRYIQDKARKMFGGPRRIDFS